MKRKKAWFKSPIHIMAPLLVASVMIMGTVAYFTDVEAVVNTIRFGQISIETNEEVSGLTKSNIGVTAQGNADCFVRIRVDVPTVSYTDANGEKQEAQITLADEKAIGASAWLTYSNDIEIGDYTWVKGDDGFWYLDTKIKQGTEVLFIKEISYENLYTVDASGSKTLPGNITEDMLTIPITSEAVQADNIVDDSDETGAALAMEAFDRVANKNTGSDQ